MLRPRAASVVALPVVALLALLALLGLAGCGPSLQELEAVQYAPAQRDDWEVSTPEQQGLEPLRVAELYYEAGSLEKIDSLLVVKDDHLVAERYYHDGDIDRHARVQSVTKSFTSALVGIALERGCFESVDQPMVAFFPELSARIRHPRKEAITVRQLLQMRGGFAWEESDPALFELLYEGFRPSSLLQIPLSAPPGTAFQYSNLSSHLLGIIVARACDQDLDRFADEHLFGPLGIERGPWQKAWEGYTAGHADLHLRARDMARFGQLYLDGGAHRDRQVVPAGWVARSLQDATEDINFTGDRAAEARQREDEEAIRREMKRVPVTLYVTQWCPHCRRARAWLSANGYRFTERDVEADRGARRVRDRLNPKGSVPTIDVDGATLVGFSAGSLEQALRRRARQRLDL